jgi:hypothetical protein
MRQLRLCLAVTLSTLLGCGQAPSGPDALLPSDPPERTITAASAGFGGITIVLDMQPNRAVDLAYTTAGKKLKSFTLDDDGTSSLPDTRSFVRLKPGRYAVQQAVADRVTLEDIVCESTPNGGSGADNNTIDLANRRVAIQLEREEAVTCTFVGSQPIWKVGDFVTYPQGDWGDLPGTNDAAALLELRFDQVYGSTFGVLRVGILGAAGHSISLGGASGVLNFLPALGPAAPLTEDLTDPITSPSGSFGGNVVALELNTDFAVADFLPAGFGTLAICGVTDIPSTTVDQFLATANSILGGGASTLDLDRIATTAAQLNASFMSGVPTDFAQDHLVSGACL